MLFIFCFNLFDYCVKRHHGMSSLLDNFLRDIPFVTVGVGKQLRRIEWTRDLLSSQVLPYAELVFLAYWMVSQMSLTICSSTPLLLNGTMPALALLSFTSWCMTASCKTYTCYSAVSVSSHIANTTKSLTALVLAFFAASLDLGLYFLEELKQLLLIGIKSYCDGATPLAFDGDGNNRSFHSCLSWLMAVSIWGWYLVQEIQ